MTPSVGPAGPGQRASTTRHEETEMAARKNAMTSKPQAATTQKTVTLRLDLSLYGEGRAGKLGESWIAGRLVARRPDWDKPVELGKNVTLVRGGFRRWEGTAGKPALGSDYPTVVDIHGVPQAAAEKAEREFPIITRVVAPKGETIVGAWQRTQTDRRPGMGARAEAKMSGPAPKAKPAAAAKPAAPAKPAAAPKAAAKPAPKAKPAPARKAKPAAKPKPRPKAKVKARPAPKPKARAKAKSKPARRPARKVTRRPAKPSRRAKRRR
jgi:hypothetical protein